jgi:hypothetical protein
MDVDQSSHASSSRTKTVYIPETTYADVTPQKPFNYRSLPNHSQAICIDAGRSTIADRSRDERRTGMTLQARHHGVLASRA